MVKNEMNGDERMDRGKIKYAKVGGHQGRKPLLTPWEQGTTTASNKGREQIAQIRLHLRDDMSIEHRLLCTGMAQEESS